MHPFVISAILMGCSAVLLLWAGLRLLVQGKALIQRLGVAQTQGNARMNSLGRLRWGVDTEVSQLLDQLGWRRAPQRARYFLAQVGLPLLVLLLMLARAAFSSGTEPNLPLTMLAVGVAFLLPKRLLVSAVKQRKRRLGEEVSTMLPLLRMFFEAGMTVEQALRVLMTEGREIVPELALELRQVMQRVDAGLELGEELRAMALQLDVAELGDAVIILEQLLRQGGGAMASLRSLKELIDERRMTALQETVSKLSAKMSGVMVAFLLPALLIVLAGPGLIAVLRSLGEMQG
jgi:tight adherence protein C